MTLTEIDETVARFVAAGRRNIPVPISEWREMMTTKSIGAVDKKALAKGKVKPVVKANASQRIGRKAKADRLEKAWKGVTKDAKGNVIAKADDAFVIVGSLAYTSGKPITDCPHDGRTIAGKAWRAGWAAAAKEANRSASQARKAKA